MTVFAVQLKGYDLHEFTRITPFEALKTPDGVTQHKGWPKESWCD